MLQRCCGWPVTNREPISSFSSLVFNFIPRRQSSLSSSLSSSRLLVSWMISPDQVNSLFDGLKQTLIARDVGFFHLNFCLFAFVIFRWI